MSIVVTGAAGFIGANNVRVTPKGRALTLSAVNSHMETEQALIKGLSVSERATLASLLKKLIVTQDQKLTKDALP